MAWHATRTGAMAVESGEGPLVLRARPMRRASRCLRPLINFSSRISWAREGRRRSFSASLHLTYAAGNICCRRRRGLNGIAALFDPILPSSYGPILSEWGEINICTVNEQVLPTKGYLTASRNRPHAVTKMAGANLSPPPTAISPAWYPPPVT